MKLIENLATKIIKMNMALFLLNKVIFIKTRKPYRLIYPVSEYVANSANVPNMVAADAFAINAFTPFWKR